MNLRRLLPVPLRWHFAQRWVRAAEAAELLASSDSFTLENRERAARAAVEHYLKAVQWWPVQHARQLPPPSNVGAWVGDEALYGVSTEMVPCVQCGTPIPRRPLSAKVGGLYCTRCA